MATGRIKKRKKLSYAKWGYIFIAPFFIIYAIFSLVPLVQTFIYSFCDYSRAPFEFAASNKGFCGFDNFVTATTTFSMFKTLGNTMVIWLLGFIPQIVVSLLLAVWFTDSRLKIKGATFFKAIIYMPNLIMASALSTIFQSMASQGGPIDSFFEVIKYGTTSTDGYDMFSTVTPLRWLVAGVNFTMWFGNTTILLMAGIMGIDDSIFEAATIDGAGPIRTFKDITMPLLMPIFIYVFLTSLVGGIQMYDVPSTIIRNGNLNGGSNNQIQTMMMVISMCIRGEGKQFGVGSAISVIVFAITAIVSFVLFKTMSTDMSARKRNKAKKVKANV